MHIRPATSADAGQIYQVHASNGEADEWDDAAACRAQIEGPASARRWWPGPSRRPGAVAAPPSRCVRARAPRGRDLRIGRNLHPSQWWQVLLQEEAERQVVVDGRRLSVVVAWRGDDDALLVLRRPFWLEALGGRLQARRERILRRAVTKA